MHFQNLTPHTQRIIWKDAERNAKDRYQTEDGRLNPEVFSLFSKKKKKWLWAGKDASEALTVLQEELGSIPNPHMVAHDSL